jgi:Serine endopeptidase inhibitors
MSECKTDTLAPKPFFARFLEGQHVETMTREEMAGIRGGVFVTQAYPSDQEGVPVIEFPKWFDDFIEKKGGLGGYLTKQPDLSGILPGHPAKGGAVTLKFPSDNEGADDVTL